MTMPREIVFARHGQSESNTVQKLDPKLYTELMQTSTNREWLNMLDDLGADLPSLVTELDELKLGGMDMQTVQEIFDRADWQTRLTDLGVEQAKMAKEVIDVELGGLASFDALYVSPFMRARETAAYMGGVEQGGWMIDDRLVERNWGVYGKLTREQQRIQYPLTRAEKSSNPWYARLDGGETMAEVYQRYRDFESEMKSKQAKKRVFVVGHGESIKAAIYGIEYMLPEKWEEDDNNKDLDITNVMMVNFVQANPNDAEEVRDKLAWRRYINPLDRAKAPYDGQWVELKARQRYFGYELLKQVERSPRLIQN